MTHLQKSKLASIVNWVSLDFTPRGEKSSLCAIGVCHIVPNLRFYRTQKSVPSEEGRNCEVTSSENGENTAQMPRAAIKEAKAALTDYLHSTRSLPFVDAEYISRNSPNFLNKLLRNVKNEDEMRNGMDRFLRYHPINEFEPFFESMGLNHSEYSHFLPRDLIYLNDDARMVENYRVLCNYGIARNRIGKFYKEAREIFKYDNGVLGSKLQAFEQTGLSQSYVIKVISSCPNLLIGDNYTELCNVLEKFKKIGIGFDSIEGYILECSSYNWSRIFWFICLLSHIGCNDEQLRKLIRKRPLLLLEASESISTSLIVLLLKFGSGENEICSMFLGFPNIPVCKFLCNLRQCYQFLVDIHMETICIGGLVRLHPLLLGSCSLKKFNTLQANLSCGKKRLRDLVYKNPEILKDWVLGSKIKPLSNSESLPRSRTMKIKFLSNLGFVENSIEMEKALKVFRGNGEELQERFDYLVSVGLSEINVVKMIKVAPQILNQSKDVIRSKIDFLTNELGFPLSVLESFPAYLSYTRPRVKVRISLYNWLKFCGKADPNLSLSTIIACSDKIFVKRYVNRHPQGPEVFEKMKKDI